MIDTVVLRIHDVKKYRWIPRYIKFLENTGFIDETSGYTTGTLQVPETTMNAIRKKGVTDPKEIFDVLELNNSGEFLMKSQVLKAELSSSHYKITHFVNDPRDYIEINLSIPKYLWGTNVLLFKHHLWDGDYSTIGENDPKICTEKTYKLLIGFIKLFLKENYYLNAIDLADVEINRLDVCFNQVFATKQDALMYLDYQKRLKKKHSRDDEGVIKDYATSLMYTTPNYSAKIYHKGSEYEKHDSKEHVKYNDRVKSKYFRVQEIQAFADRILRYEITVRNKYLNYLHKNHLFRLECPIFQQQKAIAQKVEADLKANNSLAKKIGELKSKNQQIEAFVALYRKIEPVNKKVYKEYQKLVTRRRYFLLETSFSDDAFNYETTPFESDKVMFTKPLLMLCFKKLWDFIDEFQVTELPDIDAFVARVEMHNKFNGIAFNKADLVNFYQQLVNYQSFKELKKFMHVSRATFYRYKAKLKLLGITDNQITVVDKTSGIPKAPKDLNTYHYEVNYNNRMISKQIKLPIL